MGMLKSSPPENAVILFNGKDLSNWTTRDGDAAAWLGKRALAAGNASASNSAAGRIARLMTSSVYAYFTEKLRKGQQELIERVIRAAETQLKAIVQSRAPNKQVPDITAAMLSGGPGRTDKMTLALNKWIGTTQSRGLLNDAPFNLKPGLGIERPSPTTAPSPSSE